MRPSTAALFSLLGWILTAPSAFALERAAVVVGVDNVAGAPQSVAISGAGERAKTLGETLKAAGYERVEVLSGPAAAQAQIIGVLDSVLASLAPQGTLLVVFEGHGVGGDYGDARLLGSDAQVADGASDTLDAERLPLRLVKAGQSRHIVILTDAVHAGSFSGSLLKGPVAGDWYNAGERFGTISSTNSQQVATPGVFQGALVAGLQGDADADRDGTVTFGELFAFLQQEVSAQSGERMLPGRAGGLPDSLLVATAVRLPEKVEAAASAQPVPSSSPKPSASPVRPSAKWVAATGAGVGALSLGMYVAKRSECVDSQRGLICGDSRGYVVYRRVQHGAGWLSGVMLATGTALWLLDSGPVSVGPTSVHLRGHF